MRLPGLEGVSGALKTPFNRAVAEPTKPVYRPIAEQLRSDLNLP